MKKINHPNVVNLFDVHMTKHNIYLIMELIRGEELYDKIGKSRRIKQRTLHVLTVLCSSRRQADRITSTAILSTTDRCSRIHALGGSVSS